MAFEIEFSNSVTKTDEISMAITEAFVQGVVCTPLIRLESIPADTQTKKWRKDGNLVAEELAESAPYTFSANSEITQSSVSSTARKFVVSSKLTVEAMRFGKITLGDIISHQAKAIARDHDDEIKALYSSFTAEQVAASTLTKDDLYDAEFTVRDATAGVSTDRLVAVMDYKGHNEVRKELTDLGGAVMGNPDADDLISLLINRRELNGLAGRFGGLDVYVTSGLPLDTGDDVGLVYDRDMALAGMIDPVRTEIVWNGSGGFFWEQSSYTFADFVLYNDEAGCRLKSDT